MPKVFHKILVSCLAAFAVFVAVIIIGDERERRIWQSTPSTLDLYSTKQVCSVQVPEKKTTTMDRNTTNDYDPKTLDSIDHITQKNSNAYNSSRKVLHCGTCGACSNVFDLAIYHHTRNTLTNQMTNCAKHGFYSGNYTNAFVCLKDTVGLTDDCSWCWVQNAVCNLQNCVMSCLKHRILPPFFRHLNLPNLLSHAHDHPQDTENLDPCLACDERMCGPEFLICAGANRRRAGVTSDIMRDRERELCHKVDMEWILQQSRTRSSSKVVYKDSHKDEL